MALRPEEVVWKEQTEETNRRIERRSRFRMSGVSEVRLHLDQHHAAVDKELDAGAQCSPATQVSIWNRDRNLPVCRCAEPKSSRRLPSNRGKGRVCWRWPTVRAALCHGTAVTRSFCAL